MNRVMLRAKLHRATVTEADLHYEGSCGIDSALLEQADMREFERIELYMSFDRPLKPAELAVARRDGRAAAVRCGCARGCASAGTTSGISGARAGRACTASPTSASPNSYWLSRAG